MRFRDVEFRWSKCNNKYELVKWYKSKIDVVEIITIKKKWGLALKREEKMLQRHIRILTLRSSYE